MDLKRCPFCGGAAECADLEYDDAETVEEEREPFWQAGCGDCGVYTMPALTAEEAAETWNTRPSPLSQETVEELKWLASDAESLGGGVYRDRLTGASIARLVRRVLAEIEGKQP